MTCAPSHVKVVENCSPAQRRIVLFVRFACALALVLAAYAFTRPLQDFAVYWRAAHSPMGYHNPYSLGQVFGFQQSLGLRQPIPSPWSFVPAPLLIAFLLYRDAPSGNALTPPVCYPYLGNEG